MKWFIAILIIAIVVTGLVLLLPRQSTAPESEPTDGEIERVMDEVTRMEKIPVVDEDGKVLPPPEEVREGKDNIVRITETGFEPAVLAVEIGSIVKWVNESGRESWPASDVHPTHGEYPESGGCIGSVFDACRGLAPGETFVFEFVEAGEWGFHDHLFPAMTGSIIVE